jgi:adenosine deaminase
MIKNDSCLNFISLLPKAELHVHLEGTLTPEQYLFFAQKNSISIPYSTVQEIKQALYTFFDLSSFITVYKKAAEVLCTEQDFYDLTFDYLKKAHSQGILHTEIFFDLQSYIERIEPAIIISGMHKACINAQEQLGVSAVMIMCIMRDLSEEDGLLLLESLDQFKDKIIGIGLAGIEKDNPATKFEHLFALARHKGYRLVAHAGEECGPDYIRDTITALHVERIDHGIACMRDPMLVTTLAITQLPLTVCPLSNVALRYAASLAVHPIRAMFDAGIMVTINSDDPAFFGGYCADNYVALAQNAFFSCKDLITCAANSIKASFCADEVKQKYLQQLESYAQGHACE